MRKVYVDGGALAGADGPMGVILGDDGGAVETVVCGVRTYSMPVRDRNRAYELLWRGCGIGFVFADEQVRAEFYPVPQLMLFAYDNGGGCFCTTAMDMDLNAADAPVYHINGALECTYVAPNLRALITTAVYNPGLMRQLGVARPVGQLSYAEQQYLIERLELRAADAVDVRQTRTGEEIAIFRSGEIARQVLEFVELPGMEDK